MLESNNDYLSEKYTITTSKDVNECHEKCYSDFGCLAYSYANRKCVLKYDKRSQTKCPEDSLCHTIPGNI